MRKKLIILSAVAGIAIFASYAITDAQFGGGGVGLAPTNGPDIENEIRNLYVHLQWEREGESNDDEASARHAKLVAKHAELFQLLSKYMASARIKKAVAEFEIIIKEMPDTDEARRAAAAIEALKATPSEESLVPARQTPTPEGF
ncbi:hypothetical protein [Schlesneria paludicola]|uniref:hypothetical protein n=1 Tax=Schlesneria paludicola TaxID=360056 RepID=UPI00029A9A97|nr:hypothetical protein [Schlesneria paludicola]